MTTLRDPFPHVHKKDIKNKAGVVVAQVDYIEWAAAADRLDDCEPGWSFAIMALGPDWCHGRLTLADGRSFENVGYAENADMDWKKEPLKDAVSDSLKRCAALAGVARYLYNGATTHGTAPAAPTSPAAGRGGSSPRPAVSTVPPEPDWMDEATPVERARTARSAPAGGVDGYFTEYGTCPEHGGTWKHVPAGVSKKTGKPYGEFWSCPQMGCNEKPTQQWVEMAKDRAA